MAACPPTKKKVVISRMNAVWKLLLVIATIIGAFGGFPEPPKLFKTMAKYQVVQWGLVAILAYQGGAGENIFLAAGMTAIVYLLYKGARLFETQEYIVID